MRFKTIYIHKKTGAGYEYGDLGAVYETECKDGRAFCAFVENEFDVIYKPY